MAIFYVFYWGSHTCVLIIPFIKRSRIFMTLGLKTQESLFGLIRLSKLYLSPRILRKMSTKKCRLRQGRCFDMSVDISVVIATFNRANDLRGTLEFLAQQ